MLMIWSEVAPIREVIECSKDACFFFFFFLLFVFCFVFVFGDKGCFIFHRKQFLLRHSQKTFIKIRYYVVLLQLDVQWSI